MKKVLVLFLIALSPVLVEARTKPTPRPQPLVFNHVTVIDMTGELLRPRHEGVSWRSFPVLDLTTPPNQALKKAAQAIQMTQENGKLLVCCALGFQRSAAAIAVWLVSSGHAKNAAEAMEILKQTGRPIHLDPTIIDEVTRKK